ncbi:YopX family protein [uncultured Prevotella sp.]|uniref:YopX family protein n=1 Tax=uncultured Prevotella sp. TaxID=159272 RepID=UPI002598BBD4|nr:YopX family protein [uncultured Prevotella sp.]
MRTIKFKAKNRVCEWVKGDLLQHLDGTVYIGDNEGQWTDDGFHNSDYKNVEIVDPDTVCQFTGFLDKNGKEIYDGDVLRSDNFPYRSGDKKHDKYYAVVYYCEKAACFGIVMVKNTSSSSWGVLDGDIDGIDRDKMQDFEVIGNVHDPEWKQYREYIQEEDEEEHQ